MAHKFEPSKTDFSGEATAELIWDNWNWQKQSENIQDGVANMTYLMLDHLHHVTPESRIIAMFRDPIKRLADNKFTHVKYFNYEI